MDSIIWIIVAHPDDEILFGFDRMHEYRGNGLVISLTNGDNTVRANEFRSCSRQMGFCAILLTLPDGCRTHWDVQPHNLQDMICQSLLHHSCHHDSHYPSKIISHGRKGEYGHRQHIQTHSLCVRLARRMHIPFESFTPTVLSDSLYEERNRLLAEYTSQLPSILWHRNFFRMHTPS